MGSLNGVCVGSMFLMQLSSPPLGADMAMRAFLSFSHFPIVRGPELNLTPVLWLPSVVVDYLGTSLLIFSV